MTLTTTIHPTSTFARLDNAIKGVHAALLQMRQSDLILDAEENYKAALQEYHSAVCYANVCRGVNHSIFDSTENT